MHDPKTVAFDIRSPFSHTINGYKFYSSIVTVWHVDPEADGSDDSCGYSYARLSKPELALARELAKEIAGSKYEGVFDGQKDALYAQRSYLETILGLFDLVAWRVFRKKVKPHHLPRIIRAACHPSDNLQSLIHSQMNLESVERLVCIIGRNFKTYDRRWYQKPRYHIWHWQFQFHPWQNLKRWLFTRCYKCGDRFPYGGSGIRESGGLRHFDCR